MTWLSDLSLRKSPRPETHSPKHFSSFHSRLPEAAQKHDDPTSFQIPCTTMVPRRSNHKQALEQSICAIRLQKSTTAVNCTKPAWLQLDNK